MVTVSEAIRFCVNVLFPQRCPVCRGPVKASAPGPICPGCWATAKLIRPPFCSKCGKPLRLSYELDETPDYSCGYCRERILYFHKARGAFEYEGVVREAIHIFKYKKVMGVARELGLLAASNFAGFFPGEEFDLIANVPLHRKRLADREFDQAWAIARQLGKRLSIEARNDLLVRVKETPPQTTRSGQERLKNVKGAFAAAEPSAVRGKRLLLVDDVMTTGATVNDCARALIKAGAARVSAFTIARSAQD